MSKIVLNVYAIVVTYNGSKWVDKCFGSLVNSTIPLKVIAIDNASNDGTPDLIRKIIPQIDLFEAGRNLGFGKANNIGMKKAFKEEADYVFLLNQDAWIERDTIELLIQVHQNNQEYGILSPVHLAGMDDKLEIFFHTFINHSYEFINDLYFNRMFLKEIYPMKFINAAAWLIPKRTMEIIGGFDPIFHHYAEDNNYCHRVLYHGLEIGLVPNTIIRHDTPQQLDSLKDRTKGFIKRRLYVYELCYFLNPHERPFNIFKLFIRNSLSMIFLFSGNKIKRLHALARLRSITRVITILKHRNLYKIRRPHFLEWEI